MRFLTVKDKLFLVLFAIGFSTIAYSSYRVLGDKFGADTFNVVKELKITMINLLS
tara:strand:- start:260 stop:424 length:165 start_codon:yes stop_codon:yes gene_type:complete